MASPTQRSLRHLRQAGYLVAVVERFNPFAKVRQDLFGFADLLAVKDGITLAVQTTSGSNMAARVNKCLASSAVTRCLRAGWRCEVWGWRKRKLKRGGSRYVYELKATVIVLSASGYPQLNGSTASSPPSGYNSELDHGAVVS
jgi:hypothetical protein